MGSELDLDQKKDLDRSPLHLPDLPDLQAEGLTGFPEDNDARDKKVKGFLVPQNNKYEFCLYSHICILLRGLIHCVHDRGQKKTNNRDIDAWPSTGGGRGGYAGVSDTSRSALPCEQDSYDHTIRNNTIEQLQ